jgi:nitrogen-specific signal transduction histidine kinase
VVTIQKTLSERAWPAWIWDAERRLILAANAPALARWNLPASFDPSALIFKENDAGVLAINAGCAELGQSTDPVTLEIPLPFDGHPHFYQIRMMPELGPHIALLEAPRGGTFQETRTERPDEMPATPTWSRDLANAIPMPLLLCELDGSVLEENQEATSHRQRNSSSEQLGLLVDWVDDGDKVAFLIAQVKQDGSANGIASAGALLDHQPVQLFAHRLSDPEWGTSRILVVLHILPQKDHLADLTPESNSLQQSEVSATWREAVEVAAPLAFEMNAKGRIVFFTRSSSALLGLPASRIGGARPKDLGLVWDEEAQSCLDAGEPWSSAGLSAQSDNAELVKFETSGTPILGADGKVNGFQIVARPAHHLSSERLPHRETLLRLQRDPSAAFEAPTAQDTEANLVRLDDWRPADSPSFLSEGEFATIVQGMDAALLGLDELGRIRFANQRASELFDHDSEDLDGQRITSFFEKGFGALLGAYFSSPSNPSISKTFHEGVTANLKLPGGKRPLISIRLHPLREKSSIRYCVFLKPESKELSAEPEKSVLTSADLPISSKDQDFLALISHEIRTPLNAILGFSDFILQENFGPLGNAKYKDYINDIHESGAHILSLVEDLLDRSKADSPKKQIKLLPINLPALIDKSHRLIAQQAAARDIHVTIKVEDSLPKILGDERSVLQILLNILTNAVKFSRKGGDVVIWAGTLASGRVRIHIQDNGMGMSEADLEIALQPYGRTEEAERKGVPGTGLGLPLAKALAKAIQAKFKIESTPHTGTMVCIDFQPARAVAE